MKVVVTVPEEYMGDVIGDLNSRRGQIPGMESRSGSAQITAIVPLSAQCSATQLICVRKTQGRGSYAMEPSHYVELPKSLQEAIVSAQRNNKVI